MGPTRAVAILSSLWLAACGGPPEVRQLTGPTMGSRYVLKYVGGPEPAIVRENVESLLAEYDRVFSLWREDSEIAACNRHRESGPFPASPLLRRALALALFTAERTGGAFDPTVKPLSDLYDRVKRGQQLYTDEAVALARGRVGHGALSLSTEGVVKARADVELDLNGVVAGMCADDLAGRLRRLGVSAAMIDITGEVLCFGEKVPGQPWRIGLRRPEPGGTDVLQTVLLRDRALCTSGSYQNFVAAGEDRLHHVLDPRTGRNAPNGVVSVSVLARSAAVADALGTALMVLGPDRVEAALADWPDEPELGAQFVVQLADGCLELRSWRWPDSP